MNTEIFVAVLAALVAYRVLSPLIDLANPLSFLTQPKGKHTIQDVADGAKSAAGRGQ